MGMLRSADVERRLERRKELAGRVAGTSLGRLLGEEFRAQRGRDRFGAGHFLAAGLQPLELGQKIAARRRRQLLQILLNPTGLYHRKLPQFEQESITGPSRAGAAKRDATTKTVCAGLRSKSDRREIR